MRKTKITENQMAVLRYVGLRGLSKKYVAGRDWRTIDSLERRGLLTYGACGVYSLTESGAALISEMTDTSQQNQLDRCQT